MRLRIFTVDAFAEKAFTGNPASVCLLDQWISAELMQNIAFENNLAETAFVAKTDDQYHIRWFTPMVEVDLCGHATLAAAHVLFRYGGFKENEITFNSKSGPLTVRDDGDRLVLNFPADKVSPASLPMEIIRGLSATAPTAVFRGLSDFMIVYQSQSDIEMMSPDFATIVKAEARGIIVTAPGTQCDFVSRFFAPQSGIDEDPVTGSSHTTLIPYWSARLNKAELLARQLSRRGGNLYCKNLEPRVEIGGSAITYLIGEIDV